MPQHKFLVKKKIKFAFLLQKTRRSTEMIAIVSLTAFSEAENNNPIGGH